MKKKRDKFCELLSEKNDPFGAVFSDFFGRSLFWWVYLSIFGKKVSESFVAIFDKFDLVWKNEYF